MSNIWLSVTCFAPSLPNFQRVTEAYCWRQFSAVLNQILFHIRTVDLNSEQMGEKRPKTLRVLSVHSFFIFHQEASLLFSCCRFRYQSDTTALNEGASLASCQTKLVTPSPTKRLSSTKRPTGSAAAFVPTAVAFKLALQLHPVCPVFFPFPASGGVHVFIATGKKLICNRSLSAWCSFSSKLDELDFRVELQPPCKRRQNKDHKGNLMKKGETFLSPLDLGWVIVNNCLIPINGKTVTRSRRAQQINMLDTNRNHSNVLTPTKVAIWVHLYIITLVNMKLWVLFLHNCDFQLLKWGTSGRLHSRTKRKQASACLSSLTFAAFSLRRVWGAARQLIMFQKQPRRCDREESQDGGVCVCVVSVRGGKLLRAPSSLQVLSDNRGTPGGGDGVSAYSRSWGPRWRRWRWRHTVCSR